MEEGKFEKKYWAGIIINSVLTVIGLVMSAYMMFAIPGTLINLFDIALYILLFYYVIAGFKRPHGNLLRYLIWAFIVLLYLKLNGAFAMGEKAVCTILVAAITLTAYVSGRLNKFRQNRVLCIIILALVIATGLLLGIQLGFMDAFVGISLFTPSIIWIDITFSYLMRYHMHKEAGFES